VDAEALFDALARSTLTGSCALLAVLALRGVLRGQGGARLAYAAWSLVPLVMLASLLPAPALNMPVVRAITQAFDASVAIALPASTPFGWHASALAVWCIGAVAMTAWLTLQQCAFRRRLGPLRRVDRITWVAAAGCDVALPAVIGIWRPRIVLPADFSARHDERERVLILAHEQVHLVRGDTRVNAVAAALRCLYWFNPLVHGAVPRFRMDQELACDAVVIARFPGARRPYAEALLRAQLALPQPAFPLHCPWPSAHPLKERIAMLRHPLPSRSRRVAGVLLLAALGIGATFVAWAAQSARPLVTRPLAIVAAPGTQVDAQLQFRIDGAPPTSVRVVHSLGEPFSVMSDGGAPPWQAEMIARAVEGGAIELAMTIRRDGQTIAKPLIVVRPGDPASIESGVVGQPNAWRIDATLHLRDAGWKPEPAADSR
jgi:beta-lactamase regulating signal transducer with metallopeptidase domain